MLTNEQLNQLDAASEVDPGNTCFAVNWKLFRSLINEVREWRRMNDINLESCRNDLDTIEALKAELKATRDALISTIANYWGKNDY